MASTQEVEAGRAFVRLFLKNDMASQLSRALKASGEKLKSFGRGAMVAGAKVTGVGVALLAPLAAAVNSFAAEGDMLDKMSLRTGIAASSLAELGFAAEQSGTSLDAVGATVLKMNRRFGRVTAGAGTANQISALEELGLSVDQLRAMDAEGRFLAIGDAVAKYGDNAAAAGLAQRVFGTGIDAVIPLLIQGKEGIAALRAEARDLGIVPTQEEVANAAKVTDAINRIKRAWKAMKFNIGSALAEPALKFLNVMKKVAVSVGSFAKRNKGIILAVAAIGAALVVVGTAVATFGVVIWGAGMALTALGSVVGALLSPIGLIVAAVVGGAVAFVKFSDSGKRAWTSLLAVVKPIIETLVGDATTAWDGIRAALAAGDTEAALKIVVATMQLEWARLVNFWMEKTVGFRAWWGDVVVELSTMFDAVVDHMRKAWEGFIISLEVGADALAFTVGWLVGTVIGGIPWEEMGPAIEADIRRRKLPPRTDLPGSGPEIEEGKAPPDIGLAAAKAALKAAKKVRDDLVTAAKALPPVGGPEVAGGGAGGGGVDGPAVAGIPRGAALTATYSAAAARIAGFQAGGGPEKKMADGITEVAKNTKEMTQLQQQFLAGWRVA